MKSTSGKNNYLFLGIGITLLIILGVALAIIISKQKPKQPASMNTLFVYDPKKGTGTENLASFDKNEPAFSIKLPDGWYFDKSRPGNKRLLVQSPTTTIKGYEFRAVITVSIVPTNNDLDAEVAFAKKEIGTLALNNRFLTDKPVKVNGYPAYQLEYDMYRKQDADAITAIIGKDGPFTHTVDVIAVKDGYFVDISATMFAWQWKDYATVIQKSLNSFTFLQ